MLDRQAGLRYNQPTRWLKGRHLDNPSETLVDISKNEEMLTVAETARQLGIDPKQVRRYAEKLTGQDRTASGHVPLRVRLSAIAALRPSASPSEDAPPNAIPDSENTRDRTGQDTTEKMSLIPSEAYRQRVADLEAQNTDLRADKERLYRLLEQSQANLAREQSLRVLIAPLEPTPDATPEPEAVPEPKAHTEEPTAEAWQVGSKNLTFWQRLWKRY